MAAGVAMGAAAALKWTAWPPLPVGSALLAVTAGRRAAVRAGVTALAVPALADPHAFVEHVVLFPLGADGAGSPATSPLPGRLPATCVPGGRAPVCAPSGGDRPVDSPEVPTSRSAANQTIAARRWVIKTEVVHNP